MRQLSLAQIEQYTFDKSTVTIDEQTQRIISNSFHFLTEFSKDKIIYGINTGFGPMAQFRIENHELNNLQYNLIRSHSSGQGKHLEEVYARSVMLARLNTFLQGHSGVSTGVIEQLIHFLNHEITPEIFEHGSVGASGDLVQLAHLGLNLIGEGYVYYKGVRRLASEVLGELGLAPLQLRLRDGLALMNGTSCMTGIGAINLIYAHRLLQWSVVASAVINEIVNSFDDSFSKELNAVKLHKGQQEIAALMRSFLKDSQLIQSREELFKDTTAFENKQFKKKIQEYYSLRCVPQVLGPILETLDFATKIIEDEINSTNDNPIVDQDIENVFHGGNFHGDYISLEMDKVKIVITKLTMLMERQLNFLMNSKLNEKFSPFLNAGVLGLNFGYQGVQFTATSTTAESQSLSTSVYVHSIPNNNDNQDIVSMGTNSALLAKKVIDNGFQVMAIHLAALCQAIDLLTIDEQVKLSSCTRKFYDLIRSKVPFVLEDQSHFEQMKDVCEMIMETNFEI